MAAMRQWPYWRIRRRDFGFVSEPSTHIQNPASLIPSCEGDLRRKTAGSYIGRETPFDTRYDSILFDSFCENLMYEEEVRNPLIHSAAFHIGSIRLHAIAAGPLDGPVIALLHCFPEFWFGWRNQIGPLAAAITRAINHTTFVILESRVWWRIFSHLAYIWAVGACSLSDMIGAPSSRGYSRQPIRTKCAGW
jgi:hypothetical protein